MDNDEFRLITGVSLEVYKEEVAQHKVLMHHAGNKEVYGVTTYLDIFGKVKELYTKEVIDDGTS